MVKRIYATRLLGISDDDQERAAMIAAERIAQEFGKDVDEVLREAEEAGRRVLRYGLDSELRRFARDHGLSEEEVRARYEELTRQGPKP